MKKQFLTLALLATVAGGLSFASNSNAAVNPTKVINYVDEQCNPITCGNFAGPLCEDLTIYLEGDCNGTPVQNVPGKRQ